jgi:broad specificity phosphatase PhoE
MATKVRSKKISPATAKRRRKPHIKPPATRLLLIRHGEVEVKYQGIFGGRIDMNLSPRGKRQAKILADYLKAKTIDAVYASPMKRVQQTLSPTLKSGRHEQTIFHDLREIDFGDWTGLDWHTVRDRFNFAVHEWLDQIEHPGAPNGESGKTFRARLEPCLRDIIARHPGQNVAVFCHGGVIRALLAILLELPLPKTNSFEVEYASITQVALHPHMAEIELLNFTPWRDLVG